MKLNGIDLDKEHGPVKSAGSVTHRPNNKKYREDRWGCHDKPRPAVYVLESVCVSVCVKMWCTVRALESYLVVNNNLCMHESFVILCVCVFVRHLLTEQEMVNRKVCAPRDWCHSGKHMYSHTCTHTHTHTNTFLCLDVCGCVCVCVCALVLTESPRPAPAWILVQSTVLSCQFAISQGAGDSLRHSQSTSWLWMKSFCGRKLRQHRAYLHFMTLTF